MDNKLLERINELAKKKRESSLSDAEKQEQKQLYSEYLKEIRSQFDATLDNVSVKESDGNILPFKKAYPKSDTDKH